jgi:hypothetical protein
VDLALPALPQLPVPGQRLSLLLARTRGPPPCSGSASATPTTDARRSRSPTASKAPSACTTSACSP